nr:hypothetical protein GCM10025732_47990 [Glycomyces mayteni]
MYAIRFPRCARAKSRTWETPDEPINLLDQLKTAGWAGTVQVVNLSNNQIVYTKYVCS